MNQNKPTAEGFASMHPAPERGSPRKPYESPRLRDWGSIRELTGGPGFDISDGDFSGSGGT